jgi:hypothetical protein
MNARVVLHPANGFNQRKGQIQPKGDVLVFRL